MVSFSLLINTSLLLSFVVCTGCQNSQSQRPAATDTSYGLSSNVIAGDTIAVPLPDYDSLIYSYTQTLPAAPGTKSVLFNANGSRLYAMNLEGMSVYEYDAQSRRLTRSFTFRPTPGMGWNYDLARPVKSYEEKPVEACLSKDERLLWVSLHNAGGIVALPLVDTGNWRGTPQGNVKKVYLNNSVTHAKDSLQVPLVPTGATPKVIARTANDSFVLVSNWHGLNVSVLIQLPGVPYLQKIKDVAMPAIPRGIVVDDTRRKTYVAVMGSNIIAVIDNATWQRDTNIVVASNPRHLVIDSVGRLFVSFNNGAKVACIDPVTRNTLFSINTGNQPRSIVLSKNGRFLMVTCYSGNQVDIFEVKPDHFRLVYSLPCGGKPVGIDVRETDTTLEAWVCNYVRGDLSIFAFTKKQTITKAKDD